MRQLRKLMLMGVTGVITAAAAAVIAAQPAGEGPTELLIVHALGMAIDGTSLHLTARQLATDPDRKPDEGKAAIEQLRKEARSNYENSQKLFQKAHDQAASNPGAQALYNAAADYVKTMWTLTKQATPVDEKPDKTKETGELSLDDLASIEAINSTVRGSAGAYELRQLTLRLGPSANAIVKDLDDHAGKMASASKKASLLFPKVAEHEAKAEKAKAESAKAEAKAAGPRTKSAVAEIKKAAKAAKKSAEKTEKKAKKAQEKAEAAEEKAFGEHTESTVQTLAQQGRTLVHMLDKLTEGDTEKKKDESKKK